MAWDLDPWSSSINEVASDDSYYEKPEWQCSLYFGRERDVIEEDILNEESCIHVLKILITKADTEIEGLEKDLTSLQNELAWAEYEKWPEICCGTLTERIKLLDVAINTLKKNDHANDTEVQLLLDKPAETVHEIVEALHRDHFEDIHGQQHIEMVIFNPVLNDAEHALDKGCSSIGSNIIIKEEGKEPCGTPENSRTSELLLELHGKSSNDPEKEEGKELRGTSEDSRSSELLLELHGKRLNDAEKIQELVTKSLVTCPGLGSVSCAADHSEVVKLSGTANNMLTKSEEVRSQLIAIGAKGRKMYLSSRLSASQFENYDLDIKNCDLARKPARRACKKGSKVAPDEDLDSMELALQVVYPQELCLADTESCSFEGSYGDKSQDTRLIHAENSALISLLKKPTQSALFPGIQLIDEEKQPPQGVKSKIVAKKSNLSFPSKLKSQGKRKADSEAFSDIEAYDSPTEVDPNTRIVVSTKWKQASTGTASLNESKITERAVQPVPDETECRAIVPYIIEAHDNPTEVDPSTLLVASTKREWESKTSSGTASLNESMNGNITKRAVQPGPDGSECRAIVPYISEARDNPTDVDPSKMLIVSTKRRWKSKTSTVTTILSESMNSNITKRAVHPGLDGTEGCAIVPYISEAHGKPTKVDPSTSIVASSKRQCKSKTSTGTANLNEPMNRKTTKRAELGLDGTESHSVVPYNSEFSELQKRRLSKWPITAEIENSTVNLDSPNPDRVSMDNGSQVDLHIVESYSLEDSHNETTASQLITLEKLNLPALRAMAKQYDLKKYYKLRKAQLLQQLVERMSNC
ncbi:PREDICTED: uncharacterized protein LOC109348223 isoform X2 [Lupinus angustifolius]|uniref:uncharacterized protein LOC109348223 isoform X2 n=1 Tax=Lupinus angustifolius TaxID=3871 RepID=UPI00092F1F51|nr:PREDICTED: uncharacterized protein LOC109348223 isoform X2 [Lupinus angustifolius]XP_019444070.1 PREDICTED: uncharacterized protein LOC109348223 isoform X2 [Lupinus angustifolius]